MESIRNFLTARDVERIARRDPTSMVKGRITDLIADLEASYEIPFSRTKVMGPKQTLVYSFTEDEANLTAIFVRVKHKRPHAHGRKSQNIYLEDLYIYHTEFIRQIQLLPDSLRHEIEQDHRFSTSEKILQTVGSIQQRAVEAERLFYFCPPEITLKMLLRIDEAVSVIIEDTYHLLKDEFKARAKKFLSDNGEGETWGALLDYARDVSHQRMARVRQGYDPDAHFLDHVVADHLRRRILERVRTQTELHN